MNSRPKDPKTARNKNVLIVGGSGSGKTRFWLKPNLLQCTSKTYPTSFVVTDPKGDIVVSCGHALQKNGYQIKILNSLNFKKSIRRYSWTSKNGCYESPCAVTGGTIRKELNTGLEEEPKCGP